jgi:hypothetical protein
MDSFNKLYTNQEVEGKVNEDQKIKVGWVGDTSKIAITRNGQSL